MRHGGADNGDTRRTLSHCWQSRMNQHIVVFDYQRQFLQLGLEQVPGVEQLLKAIGQKGDQSEKEFVTPWSI
jgi:hypothetical protein